MTSTTEGQLALGRHELSGPELRARRWALVKRAATPYVLILPAVVVLCATVVYPILYNGYISLFEFNLISDPEPTLWLGLANYLTLLNDTRFWNAARVTTLFTVLSVAIELALGLGLALLVTEEIPARRLVRTLLIAPILTTPLVVALVFRLMWHDEFGVLTWLLGGLGLDEVYWLSTPGPAFIAVLLTEIWQHTAFVFLVLLSAMQMLPSEPYEAAKIDGAGYWLRVWHITLPLLRSAILVAVLFRMVFNIRLFEQVYVLTGGGPNGATETISVLIQKSAFHDFDMGYAAAMSVLLTLLTVVLAVGLVRVLYRKGG